MFSKLVAIMQDNPWHTVTFATLMFTMLGASIGLWGTVMFNWPISEPILLALLLVFHLIAAILVMWFIIEIANTDASEEAFGRYFLIYLLGIVIFSEVAFLIQPYYTFLPIIAMSLLAATLLGIGSILLFVDRETHYTNVGRFQSPSRTQSTSYRLEVSRQYRFQKLESMLVIEIGNERVLVPQSAVNKMIWLKWYEKSDLESGEHLEWCGWSMRIALSVEQVMNVLRAYFTVSEAPSHSSDFKLTTGEEYSIRRTMEREHRTASWHGIGVYHAYNADGWIGKTNW